MPQRSVRYCGMEGVGGTAKAARENARQNLEAAMTGSYSPWVFRDRDHVLFIWREPTGWGYRIVWPDSTKGQQLYANTVPLGEFNSVCSHAAFHFAQSVYEDLESVPEELRKWMSSRDKQELIEYFAALRMLLPAQTPKGEFVAIEGTIPS